MFPTKRTKTVSTDSFPCLEIYQSCRGPHWRIKLTSLPRPHSWSWLPLVGGERDGVITKGGNEERELTEWKRGISPKRVNCVCPSPEMRLPQASLSRYVPARVDSLRPYLFYVITLRLPIRTFASTLGDDFDQRTVNPYPHIISGKEVCRGDAETRRVENRG